MPLDDAFAESLKRQQGQGEALSGSALQAIDTNPDEFARNLDLAKKSGFPAPLMPEGNDEARLRLLLSKVGILKDTSPATARFVTDPDNMKLSHDDLDNMSAIEKSFDILKRFARGVAASPFSMSAGFWQYPRAASEIVAKGLEPLADLTGSDFFRSGGAFKAIAANQKNAADYIRGDNTELGMIERAVYSGAESLGQNLMTYPIAALKTGKALADIGFEGAKTAVKLMAGSVAGTSYGEARDKDKDIVTSLAHGAYQGVVEYWTELTPALKFVEALNGKTLMSSALKKMASADIINEQYSTAFQDLGSWAVINPEKSVSDFLKERPSAALETLIATVVGSGGMVGLAQASEKLGEKIGKFQEPGRNRDFLLALGDGVQSSKLRERMPEKMQELIKTMKEEHGAPEHIYIDANKLTELWQSAGFQPKDKAVEMFGNSDIYFEALATGSDIAVPLEDFAKNFTGEEYYKSLVEDIRLGAGAATMREAQEFEANGKDQAMQDLLAEADTLAPTASDLRVYNDVIGQLIFTGMERGTAEKNAQVMRSVFRTLGARAGIDAFDLYQQYGLKISRPLPEVLSKRLSVDLTIDPLLDQLRTGQVPSEKKIYGKSLTEFLRDYGGMIDYQGELAHLGADDGVKSKKKKLIRADGKEIDRAREAAAEAGYLPMGSSIADFLELIATDLGTSSVYSMSNTNGALLDDYLSLQQMKEYLDLLNIDLETMNNEEIRAALNPEIRQARGDNEINLELARAGGNLPDMSPREAARAKEQAEAELKDAYPDGERAFLLAKLIDHYDGILEGREFNQVTPEQALDTNVKTELPTSQEFFDAIEGTPAAKITPDGLLIDVVRFQPEEAEGGLSVRTGVFYLPAGSKDVKHYKGKNGYGGTEKHEGMTLLRRPLFVKGATGGKAPENAYDQIKGKKAYQEMRSDVLISVVGWNMSRGQQEKNVRDILTKYGADPDLAGDIVYYSQKGNTLAYAVQENIVAHAVRDAGYDSVIGYSKGKEKTFISEIFDVREQTYPNPGQDSEIHPTFYQTAPAGPRLIVNHNLSSENLIFADKMGGLALPSLAITPEHVGHEAYGDITLIGDSKLADPQRVPVLDADAYSATFPSPDYPKVKTSVAQKVVDHFRELSKKFGEWNTLDSIWDYSVNKSDPQRIITDLISKNSVKAQFLRDELSKDIEPVMMPEPRRWSFTAQKAWVDFVKSADHSHDGLGWDNPLRQQYIKDASVAADKAIREHIATMKGKDGKRLSKEVKEHLLESTLSSNIGDDGLIHYSKLHSAVADVDKIGKEAIDKTKSGEILDAALKGHEAEFKSWVDKKILDMFAEPRIKVGGKLKPYTLENIVEFMASQNLRSSEKTMTFGTGNARASASTQFKNLEQMRDAAAENIIPKDELEVHRQEVDKQLTEWRDQVIEYYTGRDWKGNVDVWNALDDSMKALAAWAQRRNAPRALEDALAKNGFKRGIPKDIIEAGRKAGTAMLTAPVPYFEAKPQRAVKLSEFKGAVIPSDASPEIRAVLEKNGIKYVEYGDRYDEGARHEAAVKLRDELQASGENVLFQSAWHGSPKRDVLKLDTVGNFETGVPVTFQFIHNTESATKIFGKPKKDSPHDRGYEPSGRYIVEVTDSRNLPSDKHIGGEITFYNPIVMENEGWKKSLSSAFGGKTGKRLSQAIIDAGYDGVVTTGKHSMGKYTSEILDLTTFEPTKALYQKSAEGHEILSASRTQKEGMLLTATLTDGEVQVAGVGATHYDVHRPFNAEVPEGLKTANGFVTPDGKFLDRKEALSWLQANRPDVYKALDATTKKNGLESQAYAHAEGLTGETGSAIDSFIKRQFGASARSLFQKPAADVKQGYIRFGADRKFEIGFLESSNLSTFIHEGGHFYFEILADLAERDDAPQQIKDDFVTLLKHVGAADRAGVTVEMHEILARSFEAYLMEGKAPSIELQGAFQRMKAWLIRIYKEAKKLNVRLNDEVRGVFDRLVASDEEIEAARSRQNMKEVFTSAADMGVTETEFTIYRKHAEKAHASQIEKLEREYLDELERQNKLWWKESLAKMAAEVDAETKEEPVYIALQVLTKGVTFDGQEIPLKLDRKSLEKQYGKTLVKRLPRGVFAKEGGVSADQVAEMIGFESGSEMIEALITTPARREYIQAEADRRMRAVHGDLLTDGTAADEAALAIHNDEQGKVFGEELRAMRKLQIQADKITRAKESDSRAEKKATLGAIPPLEFFKDLARDMIGSKAIAELLPHRFLQAGAKAGREAFKAAAKKDWAKAAEAKQRQILNHYLYKESASIKKMVDKQVGKWQELIKKSDKKLAASRDMNVVTAARAILAQYGIGDSKDKALAALQMVKQYDANLYESLQMAVDVATLEPKPYKEMNVMEFVGLMDAVNNLWHLSRRSKVAMIDGRMVDLEEIETDLLLQVGDRDRPFAGMGEKKKVTDKQKFMIGFLGMGAALKRVEHWATEMDRDDDGPFRRFIIRPIYDAVENYKTAKKPVIEKLRDIMQSLDADVFAGKKIAAPELGYTFENKAELLHAILHTGNESNLQKLLVGRGWAKLTDPERALDRSQWDGFLERMYQEGILTGDDYVFAQNVWDLLDSLKPVAQKSHHDMYGFYFSEITAKEVETPFGIFRGGYVPALTDPFIVETAAERADQENLLQENGSSMFPATTGKGFTMSRTEGYNKPLLLDLGLLALHVDKVLRFAFMGPAVQDVGRILNGEGLKEAFREINPGWSAEMLIPWLKRTARQSVETKSSGWGGKAADGVFRLLRRRTGLQLMAANIANAMQQLTGIFPAAVKVNPRRLGSALFMFSKHPFELTATIAEKSPWMRDRLDNEIGNLTGELRELMIQSKYEKAQEYGMRAGYWASGAAQHIVDVITWQGAYDQKTADGESESASVKYADSIVRQTQGSFAPEDASSFESKSPFVRLFTQFYSYFNMIANLSITEARNAIDESGWKGGAPRLFYIYMMAFALPSFLSELLIGAMRGKVDEDDDDEYIDDVMKMFFTGQGRAATALIPGVGQVINAAVGRFTKMPQDDRMSISPAVGSIEGSVGVAKDLYDVIIDGKDLKRAHVRDVFTLLGMASGLPAAALARPIGYAVAAESGKTEPANAADYVRGLMTGYAPRPGAD